MAGKSEPTLMVNLPMNCPSSGPFGTETTETGRWQECDSTLVRNVLDPLDGGLSRLATMASMLRISTISDAHLAVAHQHQCNQLPVGAAALSDIRRHDCVQTLRSTPTNPWLSQRS